MAFVHVGATASIRLMVPPRSTTYSSPNWSSPNDEMFSGVEIARVCVVPFQVRISPVQKSP